MPPPTPEVIPLYEAGTWGPVEAELLLNCDRRLWRRL
jgi:glucose-6-phosphate 1-dehydrogenase